MPIWQPGMRVTADRLNSVTPQYTNWTPDFGSDTGASGAYGNATVNCRYAWFGRMVEFNFDVTFGSTSVFPSGGDWTFGLPVTAALSDAPIGYGSIYPGSASKDLSVLPNLNGNDRFSLYVASGSVDSSNSPASGWAESGIPYTWASGFRLLVTGQYETAS